jgi:hypothetical protein
MLCNSVGFHVLHSFHLTKSEIKVVNFTITKVMLPQEVAMFTCAVAVALEIIQNLSCCIEVDECRCLKMMMLEAFLIVCHPYTTFNLYVQTY